MPATGKKSIGLSNFFFVAVLTISSATLAFHNYLVMKFLDHSPTAKETITSRETLDGKQRFGFFAPELKKERKEWAKLTFLVNWTTSPISSRIERDFLDLRTHHHLHVPHVSHLLWYIQFFLTDTNRCA